MTQNKPLQPWKWAGLYHVLVWAIFIGYELLCLFATVGLAEPYAHYAIYYALFIALFYVNAHVILDFFFFRTRYAYALATLFILSEIVAFGLLKAAIDRLLTPAAALPAFRDLFTRHYVLANLFRQIFFIGFSIAYWALLYLTRFRNRTQQLEIEQLRQRARHLELENKYITVENAFLQNQISPHLLFNTLNFIYYSVYKQSERAGRGIMLLSDILRYSLSAGSQQTPVSLAQEVTHVEKLIELDHLRFKGKRYLDLRVTGRLEGLTILPLALLTLVENMIKHGELALPDKPASADLTVDGSQLIFKTVNKKRENTPYPQAGLGLANLRKRLSNVYPGHYELNIHEDGSEFAVHLTLDL